MLGTCPLSDMPLCDTLQDGAFYQDLVFVQDLVVELLAVRRVTDSLIFVQSTEGYTNSFVATDSLVFSESATYTTPSYVTTSDTLTFVQAAYVQWIPLNQVVNQSLSFSQSATHDLKWGDASDHLTFTDSADHNQKFVTAYNTLTFLERAVNSAPIVAVASDLLVFKQYLKSTPLYLEIYQSLSFNQSTKLQRTIEQLACNCLYFVSTVHKVIEVDADDTLIFTVGFDESIVYDQLVFVDSVTSNLVAASCCYDAYLPDKSGSDTLTFVQSISCELIFDRTVSHTLSLYGSITKTI